MNTNYFVLCAAALVMFAACQKEENAAPKVSLTASLEQQIDNGTTKTALNPTNNVIWSADDQIKVNTTNGLETLTLTDGQGTTMGSFGSPTGDNPDYAIYPASACTNLAGSTFTFTLPAIQTYAENSFANGANVAVAAISGNNMTFKNVCGILKLQLKGSMKVKKIELTGKNNEKLNGSFTVDAAAANPSAVKLGNPASEEKTLTLDCSAVGETTAGEGDGGVQLDFSTATTFNIIVPVGAFAAGFEAIVYDVAGESYSTNVETNSNNTIERSTITKMPSKAVSLLPDGYKELDYLNNGNSAYIDTEIVPTSSYKLEIDGLRDDFNDKPAYLLGAKDDVNNFGVNFGTSKFNRIWGTKASNTSPNPTPWSLNVWYSFKLSNEGFYINGVCEDSCEGTFSGGSKTVFLFYCNGTIQPIGNVSIKFARLWNQDDIMTRFYLPAKRVSDNTLGMYDVVNSIFYTNDGTGSFVAGPELAD